VIVIAGTRGRKHGAKSTITITINYPLPFLTLSAGIVLILAALNAAIQTFVLPRPATHLITRVVFRGLRRAINIACVLAPDYRRRDKIMAMYIPIGLLLLVPFMMLIIALGYTLIFWAINGGALRDAFALSGSSLLTLGFVSASSTLIAAIAFSEAAIGTIMTAVLIAYLPTIYGTFQRRELLVTKLEARAGSPPSAVTIIERYFRIASLADIDELWRDWTDWFVDIEESHTSLTMVTFLRSQQPNRSWITSAGAVLDAASLIRSSVDIPMNPRADLMIRSGYLALKYIAQPYGLKYAHSPHYPEQPIAVTQAEFDAAYDYLSGVGVPMKPDRAQAWLDFAGWRVNYDAELLDLCALVMSPEAPWSGDRCGGRWYLTPAFKDRNLVLDSETSVDANSEDALPDSAQPKRVSRRVER
jgi:hypothetical protein